MCYLHYSDWITNELFHIVRFFCLWFSLSSSSSSWKINQIIINNHLLFREKISLRSLFFYFRPFIFIVRSMSFNNSKRSMQSSSNSDTSPIKKKTKIALKRNVTHSSSSDDIDLPVVWIIYSPSIWILIIVEKQNFFLSDDFLVLNNSSKCFYDS